MQRRRFTIALGATAAAGGLAWWQRNSIARALLTSRENDGVTLTANDPVTCRLTPEQEEGPFFVRAPLRRDIREDRAGLTLELNLQVVRSDACTPVADALVEIWHCDAAGRYSGYPEDLSRNPVGTMLFVGNDHVAPVNDKTYLRGAQKTDAEGFARFTTILPGWYEPRVPHIHVKAFVGDTAYVTSQLYFPAPLTEAVYREHPDYAPYGASPYHAGNDMVLGQFSDAHGLLLTPERSGDVLRASCRLGIA